VLDVFTEEVEVLIRDGIANLYWYRADLGKCWLRAGVPEATAHEIARERDSDGKLLSKRRQMDLLYLRLRSDSLERRLEISRNFVRTLVEQKSFSRQADGHRIEVAERAALKLREAIAKQREEQEYRDSIRRRATLTQRETYESQRSALHYSFIESHKLEPQPRGFELEKILSQLAHISAIPVEEPFRIVGEQIDGAIKYDGNYYLLELRWREEKANQAQIAGLYLKVEGKFHARGIFVSMNGYSSEVLESLPKGKEIKLILLDGIHITNALAGTYTLQELLEHAISHAALRCNIYCPHEISG
jgi:hypothetical protein